jgi:enoyl-CoA hydratase/carnithine racemase
MSDTSPLLPTEQTDDGIVIVRLVPNPAKPRGGVVVLDGWLVEALDQTLAQIAQQGTPTGLVLASDSERVFVAGADLSEIEDLDDEQLQRYLERGIIAFHRLIALQCPTVAAINGAALGGGLEIALHCDALVATAVAPNAKPWRIGLPEAGLGLCPGWGGSQTLPARINPAVAIRAAATGETFKATEVPDGLLDTIVPAGELRAAALSWIRQHPNAAHDRMEHNVPRSIESRNMAEILTALEDVRKSLPDTDSARAVVSSVEAGLDGGWESGIAVEAERLVELRHTPAAREKLEAFFART